MGPLSGVNGHPATNYNYIFAQIMALVAGVVSYFQPLLCLELHLSHFECCGVFTDSCVAQQLAKSSRSSVYVIWSLTGVFFCRVCMDSECMHEFPPKDIQSRLFNDSKLAVSVHGCLYVLGLWWTGYPDVSPEHGWRLNGSADTVDLSFLWPMELTLFSLLENSKLQSSKGWISWSSQQAD